MSFTRASRGIPEQLWLAWMHTCGQVDWWPSDSAPADGCCDVCESGSDDPSDWVPLYVENEDKR